MFIDKVKVKLSAGSGGNGLVAFITQKYIPRGGPGGGDGGAGGSIYFVADEGMSTLLSLKYQKHIKGYNGTNGLNKKQHGKDAQDVTIKVPCGTVIKDNDGNIVHDFTIHGQKLLMAAGGRGGRGNARFASSRNPAPKICEKGEPGEKKELELELLILADVGLVGFPSVGKSTLISVISNVKAKIANYEFTTIDPQLGVVKVNKTESFVIADLPGLIKGASLGKGLGIRFLKHIKRCRVLLHLLDMSVDNYRDVIQDYQDIHHELGHFDAALLKRPELIVATKMDDPQAQVNLDRFKKAYPQLKIWEISALTHQGLKSLIQATNQILKTEKAIIITNKEKSSPTNYLYEYKATTPFIIHNKGNGLWVVTGETVLSAYARNPLNTEQNIRRFTKLIKQIGAEDELVAQGAKAGDTIKIGGFEFELII